MMRTALYLLLVAGISAAAPRKPKGPGDALSELEGKWVVKEATTLGGIDQAHLTDAVIAIAGDQFTYTTPAKAVSRGRIKVDDKARPKRLEFEPQAEDGKPVAAGKAGRWIYEVDGDELRMASFTDADGAVPEKFDPTDRKQMIWKAKRVKD
jgi:uncharacterized protein (TIGR03067 family)